MDAQALPLPEQLRYTHKATGEHLYLNLWLGGQYQAVGAGPLHGSVVTQAGLKSFHSTALEAGYVRA